MAQVVGRSPLGLTISPPETRNAGAGGNSSLGTPRDAFGLRKDVGQTAMSDCPGGARYETNAGSTAAGFPDGPRATGLAGRWERPPKPTFIRHRGDIQSAREQVPDWGSRVLLPQRESGRAPAARRDDWPTACQPAKSPARRVMSPTGICSTIRRRVVQTPRRRKRGRRPRHPELLDWLCDANLSIRVGQVIKQDHRLR